jgi:hypothetical protein
VTLGELKKILAEFPDDFNDTVVVTSHSDSNDYAAHQIEDVNPFLTTSPTTGPIEEYHVAGSSNESESDESIIVLW